MTVTDHSKSIPQKRQVNKSSESATKWQIYTAADPTVERIIPALAQEIGLNESIVLMQIAFWIKTSNNIVNGVYWTYQSMTEMKEKAFPYWSTDTIRRIVHSLKKQGYILIDQHNKRKGDNTQWYALEPDKLSTLKSIIVKEVETEAVPPSLQVASMPSLQVATPPLQDRTTLPETPTDIEKDIAPPKNGKTPDILFDMVAQQSFNILKVSDKETGGRVAKISTWLKKRECNPDKLTRFYQWYDKETKRAARPRDVGKFAEWYTQFEAIPAPTKILVLEPEPTDYPDTADYVNLAGGA